MRIHSNYWKLAALLVVACLAILIGLVILCSTWGCATRFPTQSTGSTPLPDRQLWCAARYVYDPDAQQMVRNGADTTRALRLWQYNSTGLTNVTGATFQAFLEQSGHPEVLVGYVPIAAAYKGNGVQIAESWTDAPDSLDPSGWCSWSQVNDSTIVGECFMRLGTKVKASFSGWLPDTLGEPFVLAPVR